MIEQGHRTVTYETTSSLFEYIQKGLLDLATLKIYPILFRRLNHDKTGKTGSRLDYTFMWIGKLYFHVHNCCSRVYR